MADAGYLTIGKVVRKLQEQYPDLSVSKVRYLEDEGLLTPSRTPGGYRLYSSRDIQRLESILFLQKSRFLPLSVIKEELDGRVSSAEEDVTSDGDGSSSSPDAKPALAVSERHLRELHPIDRMPDVAGVSISLVRKLSDCGLIRLVRSPGGRDLVDGRDLRLIRACAELSRYGIEPKNLRAYVSAANREIPMLEQALMSVSRHPGESVSERRLRRDQALERLLNLTGEVRGSILRRALADEPGADSSA